MPTQAILPTSQHITSINIRSIFDGLVCCRACQRRDGSCKKIGIYCAFLYLCSCSCVASPVVVVLVLPPVASSSPLPSSYWESLDLLGRAISPPSNCAAATAVLSADRGEWRGLLLGGGRRKPSDAVVRSCSLGGNIHRCRPSRVRTTMAHIAFDVRKKKTTTTRTIPPTEWRTSRPRQSRDPPPRPLRAPSPPRRCWRRAASVCLADSHRRWGTLTDRPPLRDSWRTSRRCPSSSSDAIDATMSSRRPCRTQSKQTTTATLSNRCHRLLQPQTRPIFVPCRRDLPRHAEFVVVDRRIIVLDDIIVRVQRTARGTSWVADRITSQVGYSSRGTGYSVGKNSMSSKRTLWMADCCACMIVPHRGG
jgi:hypothetical protein